MTAEKTTSKSLRPASAGKNRFAHSLVRFGRDLRHDFQYNKLLLCMCIPCLAWFITFKYVPLGSTLVAFKDYSVFRGFIHSPWVGFKHFANFFQDPFFFRLLRNTFLLGVYNLLWGFPAPILLALMLNEVRNRHFKKTSQTLTYIPYFISVVIITGILKTMLASDGVINLLLSKVHIAPIAFFNDPKLFRTIFVGSDIWSTVGYGSIIYLAAIASIDQEMYEAARIDGASRLQSVWHITLPSIMPTILILLVLRIGSINTVGFEKVYLLYSPATYETADVISTYVYRRGMENRNVSYATAVDLFNSAISLLLLTIANRTARKVSGESIW